MERIVFTGGSVFDGRRHRGRQSVLVEDGRVVAVGEIDRDDGWPAPRSSTWPAGWSRRVSSTPTCTWSRAVSSGRGVTSRSSTPARTTWPASRSTPPRTPIASGCSAEAGRWQPSPEGRRPRPTSTPWLPDRPVFLPNRDHHGAWVNSRALELAGVDRHTPDPHDGRIERDAEGRPTGTLHEGAMGLVGRLLPPTTDEEYDAALLAGQAYLHSLGVTGWQDAIVGAYAGMDDPGPTYRRAAERGSLTGWVVGALWWDRDRGVEQVADLVARRADYSHGRFRATSVKIMQDGVAENFTAAMSEPYLDRCGHPTDNRGHSFVAAGALREAVPALVEAGFQVHVHAIGDRGVREALDAFAAAPDRRRPAAPPGAPAGRRPATTSPASPSSDSPPTCRRCGPASTTRWWS